MTSRKTHWRRLAERDLAEAYLFVGADSPAAAERLLDAVNEATRLLLANPGIGRLRAFQSALASGVRAWPTPGFPNYLIFYRASDHDIEIVRFLHGARDLSFEFGEP